MPQSETLSVTLVSGEAEFCEEIRRILPDVPFVSLGMVVSAVPGPLDAVFWDELERKAPGYLLVDLDVARPEALRLIEDVIERKLGLKVVAFSREVSAERVLEAVRSGALEFISKPVDERLLSTALTRMRRLFTVDELRPRSGGRVLAFCSTKGGSGATTVACNTAVALALRVHMPVLLVDLNLRFGELALFLGLRARYTVLDLLSNLHRADDALLKTFVTPHESGVHLLAAPDSPASDTPALGQQIRRAIEFLRRHYGLILIDLSGSYSEHAGTILDLADEVFLVCTADLPSIKNIQRALGDLRMRRFDMNRVHVVLNRHKEAGHGVDAAAIERVVGEHLFWSIPNDYPAVIRAINSGIPVVSTNHKQITRSFLELARRLDDGKPQQVKVRDAGKRRFLSKR